MSEKITDLELQAYIDGVLDAEHARDVEAATGTDAELAQRLEGFRADKAMLKRVYGPLVDRPIPQAWIERARAPIAPARPWRLVGAIAAAIALAVVGTVGYREMRPRATSEIVQAALDVRAHPPADEKAIAIRAGEDARRFDAVLSAAVALRVKVPDLQRMGYRLTGIRLYGGSPAAAELVYRDDHDRVFTLYLRHSNGTVRFDQFERNGLRVCVWQDEQLSTVMAGNVSTAAMQRLASLAYTGLTL